MIGHTSRPSRRGGYRSCRPKHKQNGSLINPLVNARVGLVLDDRTLPPTAMPGEIKENSLSWIIFHEERIPKVDAILHLGAS